MTNIQVEKTAIGTLVAEFAHTLNTHETESLPAFFAQDAIFMPDGHQVIVPGRLNRRSDFLARVKFKIEFKEVNIVVENNYAFALFMAIVSMWDPQTNVRTQKQSRDFFVFRKEQGPWKIYRYMFNNVKEIKT